MIELAVAFLAAYMVKKGFGPIDREVDAKLDALWANVKSKLSSTPTGAAALERLEENPGDPALRRQLEAELRGAAAEDGEFARGVAEWLQTVDTDVVAAWIAAETGADLHIVHQVLDVEAEYMEGVGITNGFRENFIFYRREQFENMTEAERGELDVERVGSDASRFLGIPSEIAVEILEAETRYLQLRGIAGPELDAAMA